MTHQDFIDQLKPSRPGDEIDPKALEFIRGLIAELKPLVHLLPKSGFVPNK